MAPLKLLNFWKFLPNQFSQYFKKLQFCKTTNYNFVARVIKTHGKHPFSHRYERIQSV